MHKAKKVVVKKERSVHTYAELWHASNCLLSSGVKNPEGSSWQFLSSLVMAAFAFEAYLNHAGNITFACWEDLDRLPPLSKLKLLCEELEVSFPNGTGARPLQTVKKLMIFRNTMAHGRSDKLKLERVLNTENYHEAYHEELLTNWEKLVKTDAFAKRAHEDVRAVLQKIHDARRDNKEFLFNFGMGSSGATLIEEP